MCMIKKPDKLNFKNIKRNLDMTKSNKDIFGKEDEVPAVFSQTYDIDFKDKFTGEQLKEALVKLVSSIQSYVVENSLFIGHIKVFADLNQLNNFWISTTDGTVNIKESHTNNNFNVAHCQLSLTAIIFGTDKETLKTIVINDLNTIFKDINVNFT